MSPSGVLVQLNSIVGAAVVTKGVGDIDGGNVKVGAKDIVGACVGNVGTHVGASDCSMPPIVLLA